MDYGRCDRDNRHAFSGSANFDLGKGFGTGFVFRTYSGYPINETIGTDFNGDGNNNDRPKQGVNDQATAALGTSRNHRLAPRFAGCRDSQRHRR